MQDAPVRVGPGYRRLVVATSVGNFIEIYSVLVFGAFASFLAEQFFPHRDPTAALLGTFAIFAVGALTRPFGGIIFGHIGDRFGRRTALMSSLLLMSVATTAIAVLPTYERVGLLAPTLLLLCQILQLVSAGGEYPGSNVFLMEHAARGWRGRAISVNAIAGNLAAAGATGIALILANVLSPEQLSTWGWRAAYLVAAPIGLVGLYLRIRLADTPAFTALGEAPRLSRAPVVRALSTAKRAMLVLTAWMAPVAAGQLMLIVFLPAYLIRLVGRSPTEAFSASLIVILTQVVMMVVTGYLVDRFPLRRVMIAVMCGVAAGAVPGFFILTHSRSVGGLLLGQALWSLFTGAAVVLSGVLNLVLFAVPIRFTASALATNVGVGVFGGSTPYVSVWLVAVTASPLAPGFYLLVLASVGLLAAIVGVPGRRRLNDLD